MCVCVCVCTYTFRSEWTSEKKEGRLGAAASAAVSVTAVREIIGNKYLMISEQASCKVMHWKEEENKTKNCVYQEVIWAENFFYSM